VNMVMNRRIPEKSGNFLTKWATINFSRKYVSCNSASVPPTCIPKASHKGFFMYYTSARKLYFSSQSSKH
jgi:hypothetical protein